MEIYGELSVALEQKSANPSFFLFYYPFWVLERQNSKTYANIFSSTDIPADDILELFGKTFFEFCQDSGYDKILQVLGATPRDFLQVSFQNLRFY